MKKIFLLISFFFFIPQFSFAAYPGDCTETFINFSTGIISYGASNCSYPATLQNGIWVFPDPSYNTEYQTCFRKDPLNTGLLIIHGWFENGIWFEKNAYNIQNTAWTSDWFSGVQVGQPTACSQPDCSSERAAKDIECGGSEFVTNWDNSSCSGDCLDCSPANYTGPAPNCDVADAFWDAGSCSYICNGCEDTAEDLATKCPTGVYFYDNVTCTAKCKDCSTDYADCTANCGLGNILQQGCETNGQTLESFCVCKEVPPIDPPPDDPNNPDPPEETPLPDPDPVDPPDEIPDDTDDSADGENSDLDDLDNDLLKKITDNTDRIGDINQTEFNKLNATAKDIENKIGQGNDFLSDIKSGIYETNKNLDALEVDMHTIDDSINDLGDELLEGNGYLKKIEENTSETSENTEDIKDFLDDDSFTQEDVDLIVSDFETMLNDTWTQKEEDSNALIMTSIDGLDPVSDGDLDFITVPILSLLPTSQTCTDLDLSFKDKEIIIECDMSLMIKEILSYFVYILTMMGISLMVFRQLRPNQ